MYKIQNTDLIPQPPETPKDDQSMQRAFTQAQLIIYRERDKNASIRFNSELWQTLTTIADEIYLLAHKWNEFNNRASGS